MWTGRSGTGKKLTPDTLELDQKTEFDLSLLTGWAPGDGKIKLTVGAEYDLPLDKGHRGASFGGTLGDKSTIVGNLQVQADDLLKNDYVSLSVLEVLPPMAGRETVRSGQGRRGVRPGSAQDARPAQGAEIRGRCQRGGSNSRAGQ
jgi:hypothetical protein